MPTLVVEAVEKTYRGGRGGVSALRGVSFAVESGEFVALMGPSGCGKSSLLHILGGMDRASRGRVSLGDTIFGDLDDEELSRLRRRRIGFVFQFFNLLPTLTVEENVALPLMLDGCGDRESAGRASRMLERVGLSARSAHYPAELSGGEMQRCAIGRALIAEPELVLADEPTGNLDSENGHQVMQLLASLNREIGMTIVLATHARESADYARRVIRMRDGVIESDELQPRRESSRQESTRQESTE